MAIMLAANRDKQPIAMRRNYRSNTLKASNIPPAGCELATVNGKQIAVFNVGGTFYATQAECTHAGGPLCDGALWGDKVTCPWHGSEFNVRTGEVTQDPAQSPLTTFRVEVVDGIIVVSET